MSEEIFEFAASIEHTEEGYRIVAVVGDMFLNGVYLPDSVLVDSVAAWEGTLHDINHMGTNAGMGADITQFVGYHTNVKYDKDTKQLSMTIVPQEGARFTSEWEAYLQLVKSAGKTVNVSTAFRASAQTIPMAEFESQYGGKAEEYGYRAGSMIPVFEKIEPVAVSTVLEGACSDKDGCGFVNTEEDASSKCGCELTEAEKQTLLELIEWLRNN